SDALPIRRLRDIEVWTMTGGMLGQIRAKGPVRALAISSRAVGVLTPGEVDVYSHDGREIAAIRVPPGTAASLALAGLRPIYRVGRSIYVGPTRAPIAVAASTPVGLSVSGGRVAWAENPASGERIRGRIRTLALPR